MKKVINFRMMMIVTMMTMGVCSSCSKDDGDDGGNLDYLIGTWKSGTNADGKYYQFIQNADGSGKASEYEKGDGHFSYKWEKLTMKGGKLVGTNTMSSIEWYGVLKSHTSTQLVFDDFFGWGYVELTKQ